MGTDQNREWVFPLVEISQDKRVPRTSTAPNFANELTGVDGSLQGGLVPQAGLFQTRELDPTSGGSKLTGAGAAQYNEIAYVHDFFPVTFFLGTENFCYGYVYRVSRTNTINSRTITHSTYDVLIDYYNKHTGTWREGLVLAEEVDGSQPMFVETLGPLLYVLIKGQAPIRLYIQRKGAVVSQLSTTTTGDTKLTDEYYSTTAGIDAISGTPARQATADITVADLTKLNDPTAATGEIEVTANPIAVDRTVQLIDSEGNIGIITATDDDAISVGAASGTRFRNSGTDTQIRDAIKAAINNFGNCKITASDHGSDNTKVILTQDVGGSEGNTTITESATNLSVTNFTGGDEDQIILVSTSGVTYKFRSGPSTSTTHIEGFAFYDATVDNNTTAANLATAINANKHFTATATNAVVTVTQVTAGLAGNSTITDDGRDANALLAITTPATFTGGKDGPKGPSEVISNDTGPGPRPILYSPSETNTFSVLDIKVPERHTDDHSAWAKLSLLDVDPIPIWDLKYKIETQGYFQFDRNQDYLVTLFSDTFSTEFTTDFFTTEGFTLELTTGDKQTVFATNTQYLTSGGSTGTRASVTFTMNQLITEDNTIILVSSDGTSRTYVAKNTEGISSLQFHCDDTADAQLTSLKSCIEHSNGHNGKLLVTIDTSADTITITQNLRGDSGNTAISGTALDELRTYGLTIPTAFTGGADGLTSNNTNTSRTTESDTKNKMTTSFLLTETLQHEPDDIVRTPRRLKKGGYVFAVQFVNSHTGLKTGLSELGQIGDDDFVNVISDESSSADSEGNTEVSSLFVGLHMQYDREKWDRAYVYRSVRAETAGGTLTASVMHLDKVVKLDEYELKPDTALYPNWKVVGDIRNAIYYYELEDKQLIFQDPYLDQTLFDKTMPFGGAAKQFTGTMLVSNISGTPVDVDNSSSQTFRNMGEFRWSSLTESKPELFPVSNYYLPEDGNSEIIAFEKAASNMIAFSKDRIYHLKRVSSGVGGFIRINEIHKGYGIVNPKASCSVGNTVYFLSTKGLKTIDSSGQLDDVKAIDDLINDSWKNDLDKCEIHFDSVVSAVFILNPRQEEMICFWFNTGKVTMMKDVPFTTAGEGFFPANRGTTSSATDFDGELEKRVMFVQNLKLVNSNDLAENYPRQASTVNDSWKPKVWVYDHKKESSQTRMMITDDATARADYIVINNVANNGSATNDIQRVHVEVTGEYFKASDNYKFVYTTNNASGTSTTGNLKYRIVNVEDNIAIGGGSNAALQRIDLHPEGHNTSPTAGDYLILSPIPFEYIGHPLLDVAADGIINAIDYHSVKYADTIGVAISDITNTSVPFYQMRSEVGVYEANSSTSLVSGSPVNADGTANSGFANNLGTGTWVSFADTTGTQSLSLIPFFRTKVVGATFRLISLIVSGKILGTYNRNHPGV